MLITDWIILQFLPKNESGKSKCNLIFCYEGMELSVHVLHNFTCR